MSHRPSVGEVAWLAYAVVMLGVAFAGADLATNDFHAFCLSGLGLRTGTPLAAIDRPDLNPPIFAWVMVPFSLLPIGAAFAAWSLLGAWCLVASVRLILRRLEVPPLEALWALGAIGATMPALLVWQEGQIAWFLLYFVTRAWCASSLTRGGLWLAPAILVKPPIALLALVLPWRLWAVAGAAAGGGTLVAVAVTGLAPWLEWLAKSGDVRWLNWAANGSLWGLAARASSWRVMGAGLDDIDTAWRVTILLAAVCLVVMARRATDDRRWAAGVLVATLVSPLGWIYYLVIGLGPFLATWPRSRAGGITLALWTMPMPVLGVLAALAPLLAPLVASWYLVAVIATWVCLIGR